MTCKTALEFLSAALDGELTLEEKAQLDHHLAQCDACRALYDDLVAIHEVCGGLEVTPPPALKAQIMDNLPYQAEPAKVIPLHWKRWGAMAASFALVAMAVWQLPRFLFTPPENTQQPANQETTITDVAAPADNNSVVMIHAPTSEDSDQEVRKAAFDSNTSSLNDDDFNALTEYAVEGMSTASPAVTPSPAPKAAADDKWTQTFSVEGISEASAPIDYGTMSGSADADAADTPPALFSSARAMSVSPETAGSGYSISRQMGSDAEMLEPHPDLPEGELVAAAFLDSSLTGEADTVYCGALTLSGGITLNSCPAETLENGEVRYELPDATFWALVNELTESDMTFELRMTGADISSSAQTGLVVVLP